MSIHVAQRLSITDRVDWRNRLYLDTRTPAHVRQGFLDALADLDTLTAELNAEINSAKAAHREEMQRQKTERNNRENNEAARRRALGF
jgi:hypothetical protein